MTSSIPIEKPLLALKMLEAPTSFEHCGRYFHRDGMAASAIVTMVVDSLLEGARLQALCDDRRRATRRTVIALSNIGFQDCYRSIENIPLIVL